MNPTEAPETEANEAAGGGEAAARRARWKPRCSRSWPCDTPAPAGPQTATAPPGASTSRSSIVVPLIAGVWNALDRQVIASTTGGLPAAGSER